MTRPPKKSRRKRDSNPGSSALEADALPLGQRGGAQDSRGLWRVYPATSEARTQFLVRGIRLRNTVVQLSGRNPFIIRDETGEEKPAAKVWIDNIAISVADSEIIEALVKVGGELRSKIKLERARDAIKKKQKNTHTHTQKKQKN